MTDADHPLLDFGRDLAPIYVQLSTVFRRFIETGEWPVDGQIPTQETLAARFGVNPATVRKAIDLLAAEGLMVTRRRRGTVVIAKGTRKAPYDIPTGWQALISAEQGLRGELLEASEAFGLPRPFHGHGKLAPSYDAIRKLFRRDGQVVSIETAFVVGGWRRTLGADTLRWTSIWPAIDAALGGDIGRADQTIVFGIADAAIARDLQTPLNAPVATIHRSVCDRTMTLICEATSHVRGDRMRLRERLLGSRPDGPAAVPQR